MPSTLDYPLRLEPILKKRIWGGRRLETLFGRELPPEEPIGESWEVTDCGGDVSMVARGPQRGVSLRTLVEQFPQALVGPAAARLTPPHRFPLLVKWIDARERLSIQVHPPDGHAQLPAGEPGKSECWLVVDAEPESLIYLGLRRGIDRAALERELVRGTVEFCLNAWPARPGDFFYVPAGTVHAIGSGVLLAEIQQPSDVTFRLFDWNRADPATGRPRALQVQEALAAIDDNLAAAGPRGGGARGESILLAPGECPHFAVALRRLGSPQALGNPQYPHVLMCVAGSGVVSGPGGTTVLGRGDSALLPAGVPFQVEPQPQIELLDAWVP